jgi:hypothetical protein
LTTSELSSSYAVSDGKNTPIDKHISYIQTIWQLRQGMKSRFLL